MSQMLAPEPPTISRSSSSSSVSDITALSSSSLPFQKRKALLIGIDNQSHKKLHLYKPVKDTKAFRQFLLDQGYDPSNVITMTDDLPKDSPYMPTRDNIIRELKNLVRGAMTGDHFFFLYSGHSVQVDQVPGKTPRELDGKDEAIVPVDGADKKGNPILDKVILDDELNDILIKGLPSGCNLFAVLDTCHSATLLDLYHRRCNLRELDPSFRIIDGQNLGTSDAKSSRSSVTVVSSDIGGALSLSLESTPSTRRATINETHRITPQSSTMSNPYGSDFQPAPPSSPLQRKESQHVKFADSVRPVTDHKFDLKRTSSRKIEEDVNRARKDIAHRSATFKAALQHFLNRHKEPVPVIAASPVTSPALVDPTPVSAPALIPVFPLASSDGQVYLGQRGPIGSPSLHRVRTIQGHKRWASLDSYLHDKPGKHAKDATASPLRPPGLEGSGDNSSSSSFIHHTQGGHDDKDDGDAKPDLHLNTHAGQKESDHPSASGKLFCGEVGECDGSCDDSPTERANVIALAACADPQQTPEISSGKSLTAMLLEILRENQRPKLQYIMRKISDEFYHEIAEAVKMKRKLEENGEKGLKKPGKTPPKRQTTVEIVEEFHWDPQISSNKPQHAEDFLNFFVNPSPYPSIIMSPGGPVPLALLAAA